jgi:hypothetical protein
MPIFLKMTVAGIKRRKKEMRFVFTVTFIAVLFMSSITLLQNCMDKYLIETNYQNYGRWVLASTKDYENPNILFDELNHPFFSATGICKIAGRVLKNDGTPSSAYIGSINDAFYTLGSLTLYEGEMPRSEDEIAMDLSALSRLGYSYELGQTIHVSVERGGTIHKKNYRLTGTLYSFADNWNYTASYRPPHCIVTEEGLTQLCRPSYETHYYQLGKDYENINMKEFISSFLKPHYARVYNSYTYENRVWGSEVMFRAMKFVLLLTGALAAGYLMMSYAAHRRKWYYRLRAAGADKAQLKIIILAETAYATVPGSIVAILLPYVPGILICQAVSVKSQIPSVFNFHLSDLAVQAIVALGIILFAAVCAWLQCRDKNLSQNKHSITGRSLNRLRRDAAAKRSAIQCHLRREHMLHPFQRAASILFSCAMCTLLVLCLNRINQSAQRYFQATDGLWDFNASKKIDLRKDIYRKSGIQNANVQGLSYDMYHGINEETKAELSSLIGIERTEWQTWDQTHILQWEGKENSLIEQRKTEFYEGHSHSLDAANYWNMNFCYFSGQDPILRELQKEFDISSLDKRAFWEGEQIIVLFFGLYDTEKNSLDAGCYEKVREDSTLKPGSKAEIVSGEAEYNPVKMTGYPLPGRTPKAYNLPGRIPVTVGAVINTDSNRWDNVLPSCPYVILGSQKLAARVAKADGKIQKDNRILINFNSSQSFESTQKRLASIFQEQYMPYSSGFEGRQQELHQFVLQLCIYGSLFFIILFLFLLLQIHFGQLLLEYRSKKYRLLRQLGMEQARLRILCIKESLGNAMWMFLCIPCCYVLLFTKEHLNLKYLAQDTQTGQTVPLNRILESCESAARGIHLPITVLFTSLLIVALGCITYLSVKKFEEKENLK